MKAFKCVTIFHNPQKCLKEIPWGVNVEFRWVKGLSHFLVNVFNHF